MRAALGSMFFILASFAAFGQGEVPRPETWVTNGTVNAIVRTDSTVYIGGDFDWVAPYTGSGVSVDRDIGGVAEAYDRVNSTVHACISDNNGGWFIGGEFTRVGIRERSRIAHILADGTADKDWSPAAGGTVYALGLSPDGATVYAGGDFTSMGGAARNRLAALNAATGELVAWNPDANGAVRALTVSPDGARIYAGGAFTTIGGQSHYRIAAVDLATGKSVVWNSGANGTVYALALSGDGSTVYAGGDFVSVGGASRKHIAAIDAATGGTGAWDPGVNSTVYALSVSGTSVYAGGSFTGIGEAPVNRVARILADGNADALWNPNANGTVYALMAVGSVVFAGGEFTSIGGTYRNRMAELETVAGDATPWNPNADGTVRALAGTDTAVYAGGAMTTIGGVERNNIAALEAATGKPTDWNPNANGTVHALVQSGSGVVAGGSFTNIGGRDRNYVAVLDMESSNASSWDAGLSTYRTVYALAISANGDRLYVGGQISHLAPWGYLIAVDTGTGEWLDWKPDANGVVLSLVVSGDTLYAGGQFTSIGGQDRNYIAALDFATGKATDWNPNPNPSTYGKVEALVVSGTTVYAGGNFTGIGGQPRYYLAALDAVTGSALSSWHPDANNSVHALALSTDGKTLYAGGDFTSIGSAYRDYFAALDAATGNATDWNPEPNARVNTLTVSGASVYAGGAFTRISDQNQHHFAQFEPPSAPSNLGAANIATDRITWTWQDNSRDETGFNVWVDPGGGAPSTLRVATGEDATSWEQTELATNSQYTFQVAATSGGSDGLRSMPHSAWTLAKAPLGPLPLAASGASLSLAIDATDGNPRNTLYALQCTSTGQWVQQDNRLGDTPFYRLGTQWRAVPIVISGTAPATYRFAAIAQNGANVATDMGPESSELLLTPVPQVIGQPQNAAAEMIAAANLAVGSIVEQYSPTMPAGTVTAQTPAADVQVFSGASVALTVSKGQKSTVVPDVLGMLQASAANAVTAADLAVGTITLEYSATLPSGQVMGQEPVSGTQVLAGTKVALVVSRGPRPVAVPNVLGQTQAAAVVLIEGAGLMTGVVAEEYSANVPLGMIANQLPAAGAEIQPGSPVSLVVSKGPQPVPVPNVVGLMQSLAATVITVADLTVGTVTEQYSATISLGTVLSQRPEADTEALPYSPVSMVVSKGPPPVKVPNVEGQTQASASAAITGAGLTVGQVAQQYSATVPSGAVVSQTPQADAEALPGSYVALVISRGPQPVKVPNLVGQPQSSATAAITGTGLIVGTVTQRYSAAIPSGSVTSQHPAADTAALPGTAVDLVVSNSGAQAVVPGVVGLHQEQATASIIAAGLAVGAVTAQYSTTVPNNHVISQNPGADELVEPGTQVSIIVSQGVAVQVTVPNVTGMSRTHAEAALTGAGLVLGSVSEHYNAVIPAGNVMYQDPSAGARVATGTAVDLAVSRGPQPVSVPDLSNLSAEQAQTAIVRAGLAAGFATEEPSDTVPAGQIIRQDPPADTLVAPGSVVNFTVSSGPVSSGCACPANAQKTFSGNLLQKLFSDLFPMGAGLMALQIMSKRRR